MFYCNRVVVQAPGKVNLALDIVGTTENGYHLLDTVMLAVDLCDVLVIGKREGEEVRVTCSRDTAPEDETNIAHRAAMAFFAATGLPVQGLSIHIDKTIPVMAGLGGGSSDAAAVLCGLNRLFETSLSPVQLREIGFGVGADVPFCLQGGCALVQGIGEVITPLRMLPKCLLTIAKPPRGMSTHYAFKLYDEGGLIMDNRDIQSTVVAAQAGDLAELGRNMFNIFELMGDIDELEMLKGMMLCDGALGAVLSGSGSAVVGLFAHEKPAKSCLRHLREQIDEAHLVRPVEHGAQIIHIS